MDAQIEKEVSIKIPIKNFVNENYKHSIVVYYENDMRISNGKQQIKKIVHKTVYLKWYQEIFLPCTYTVSSESDTNYNLYCSNIKKIITRFTMYEENSIRIAIEFENNEYFLRGETEDVNNLDQFYCLFLSYLKKCSYCNFYDQIPIPSYNSITSRKFENFHIDLEINCLAIKYKYDGYKGKIIISGSLGYIFRPVEKTEVVTIDVLKNYDGMVFQIECMDDKIILTDVIGAYINGTLYSPSPMDSLKFLKHLNLNVSPPSVLDVYSIYTQHEIDDCEPFDKYDGYIFVTPEREYKVKLPTVDLQLVNNFFYYNQNDQKIQVSDYSYYFEDGIFEVMQNPHDNMYKFVVLRQRFDRHYACTENEYQAFCKSSLLWRNYFNVNLAKFT